LNEILEDLLNHKRAFISGVGRTGLIMKGFGMRLMHLGFETFVIGETTTPSIKRNDLLIIGSGSGETTSLVSNAEKAKNSGIKIILFTIDKTSKIGNVASKILEIKASSPKIKTGIITHTSFQPMGSLFEQSLLITLETIIVMLMESMNIKSETMFENHANLE
jgi:6-phospho-3-hexuloisomerase